MKSDQDKLKIVDTLNRRAFMRGGASAVGSAALVSLMGSGTTVGSTGNEKEFPNFNPKAKRIIYLFQSGAPSQMDLFDPKPGMADHHGEDLPESIRKGQRLTTMTSGQKTFPVAPICFQI